MVDLAERHPELAIKNEIDAAKGGHVEQDAARHHPLDILHPAACRAIGADARGGVAVIDLLAGPHMAERIHMGGGAVRRDDQRVVGPAAPFQLICAPYTNCDPFTTTCALPSGNEDGVTLLIMGIGFRTPTAAEPLGKLG